MKREPKVVRELRAKWRRDSVAVTKKCIAIARDELLRSLGDGARLSSRSEYLLLLMIRGAAEMSVRGKSQSYGRARLRMLLDLFKQLDGAAAPHSPPPATEAKEAQS